MVEKANYKGMLGLQEGLQKGFLVCGFLSS